MSTAEIPGFPGYLVTSDGRVMSRWKRGTRSWGPWRFLVPRSSKKRGGGYQGVTLCNGTERRSVRIHRLVAEAFIPNPDDLPCVRHLDGNPANNDVSNLAWGTYRQNEDDKRAHGTWDMRRGGGKLTADDRARAFALRATGSKHQEIADELGVSRPAISRLLGGQTWGAA